MGALFPAGCCGATVTVARKGAVTFFAALMISAIGAVLVREAWIAIALVSVEMRGYTGSLANMLAMPDDVCQGCTFLVRAIPCTEANR